MYTKNDFTLSEFKGISLPVHNVTKNLYQLLSSAHKEGHTARLGWWLENRVIEVVQVEILNVINVWLRDKAYHVGVQHNEATTVE